MDKASCRPCSWLCSMALFCVRVFSTLIRRGDDVWLGECRCFAWITCVNVWDVEFSRTKTERLSHAWNIFHNASWFVIAYLFPFEPTSQAPLLPAILVAVADWLEVMWVGVSEVTLQRLLCVAGRRWACWRGTSISSPHWPCQRRWPFSSMVRHSLLSVLIPRQTSHSKRFIMVLLLRKHSLDLSSLTWKTLASHFLKSLTELPLLCWLEF